MDFLMNNMDNIVISDVMWINQTVEDEWRWIYIKVKWIQFATAILSIIGSVAIIGYAVFQNAVRSPEVRPLFYLSMSDLLLGLCWLIGSVMYRTSTTNKSCYNLQVVGEMFYVSTFLYTLSFIWQLWDNIKGYMNGELYQVSNTKLYARRIATVLSRLNSFVHSNEGTGSSFYFMFFSAFLIVFTIPVLYFGNAMECYGNSSHPHGCLMLNVGFSVTTNLGNTTNEVCTGIRYYSTVGFLVLFTLTAIPIIILLRITYTLSKTDHLEGQQQANIIMMKRSILLYCLVFFFCSIPACILIVEKLINNNTKSDFRGLLYMALAFTKVSQGFFNCLVYGWTQNMLHVIKKSTCSDAETQTPLLSSQKRFYSSTQTTTNATAAKISSCL
ncbi:transmembrane protein 116 [Bombina bombina]|uniref:transmembrane protein 116 n=1 Tax=Bombina bombina TaxID=8345 RepID=UPI00235ACA81|nr:transmembrane protein 116 [Bombina bombina]